MLQGLVEAVRARIERLLVDHGLAEADDDDAEDGQLALQAASIEARAQRAWGTADHAADERRAVSSEWFDL